MGLLEPFFAVLGAATDDKELRRVSDNLFGPLIDSAEASGTSGGDPEEEALPLSSLLLSERLFSLASNRATLERNREYIHTLQRRAEAAADPTPEPKPKARAGGNRKRGAARQAEGKDAVAVADVAVADAPQVNALRALIQKGAKRPRGGIAPAGSAAADASADAAATPAEVPLSKPKAKKVRADDAVPPSKPKAKKVR